jgi:hypothetical protein
VDATDSGNKLATMAGVFNAAADGTSILAPSGTMSVGTIGLLNHAADDKSSLFIMSGVHDVGADAAKDTDLGLAPAKGQLIAGFVITAEALVGSDPGFTTVLSDVAAGASALSTGIDITLADTVGTNRLGAVNGVVPLTGAAGIVASGDHVYAYTAASGGAGGRTAGILNIIAVFMKTA